MTEINVAEIRPVGEFGSKAWCEACAQYGVMLLENADIPANTEWGFTEVYTHPPARLLEDGRELSGYYIMVKDERVSGGDGVINECLELPGFHVKIQWGLIANQSGSKYGREGQAQRQSEERVLFSEIAKFVGSENPLGLGGGKKPYFPREVGAALARGSESGGGLHNIAAALQSPSPEFADLPTTELGVPVFSRMTDTQKRAFLELCNAASI